MAGLGEALGLPLSSLHSSNLTSHRFAADVLAGGARGACVRYCDRKHSSAKYQYEVCESPISLHSAISEDHNNGMMRMVRLTQHWRMIARGCPSLSCEAANCHSLPQSPPTNGIKQMLGLEALQVHTPTLEVLQQLTDQPLIAGPIPFSLLQSRLAPSILLHAQPMSEGLAPY